MARRLFGWVGFVLGGVHLVQGVAHGDLVRVTSGLVFVLFALEVGYPARITHDGLRWFATLRLRRVPWDDIARVEIDYTRREVPGIRVHRRTGPPVDPPLVLPGDHDARRELERELRDRLTGDAELVIAPPWSRASASDGRR